MKSQSLYDVGRDETVQEQTATEATTRTTLFTGPQCSLRHHGLLSAGVGSHVEHETPYGYPPSLSLGNNTRINQGVWEERTMLS
jgi:hypothetical protein